jgi:hypothetical protein
MSRFYGTLRSERKTIASKGGTKFLKSHIRTWGHGVEIVYLVNDDEDTICQVWFTGGSENPDAKKLIKSVNLGSTENKRPGREYYGSPVGGS